jgi:hypothetical protein
MLEVSTVVDFGLPLVVRPDDPVDDLGNGDMFGLGFCLDPLDKRLLDMQRPALGRGGGFIGLGEEVLALAPPCQHVLKIGHICQRDVNVDFCGSAFVDFGGATVVHMGGLGLTPTHEENIAVAAGSSSTARYS